MSLYSIAYVIGWAVLWVFRVEAHRESLAHYAPTERLTVQLAPIVISIHVTLACVLLGSEPQPSGHALTIAAALFAAAIGFWFWGRRLIGPLLVRRSPEEPPLEFRRDGAFGVVRHPLYSSYVLLAFAPVIACPRPLLAVTFLAAFAAIAVRATQEERRLRDQLGEQYDEYSRRVRRLIPFVW